MPVFRKMDPNAEPVVDAPRKGKMTAQAPRPRRLVFDRVTGITFDPLGPLAVEFPAERITRGVVRMAAEEDILDPGMAAHGVHAPEVLAGARMDLPEEVRVAPATGDQKEKKAGAADREEGYVRIRFRVMGDKVEVVGFRRVAGPLLQQDRLRQGAVYELRRAGRRLAVGNVPDFGVRRSFPHPDDTEGRLGHHIAPLDWMEFTARVPASEFKESALRGLDLRIYQVKGPAPVTKVDVRPLDQQFPRELRTVASMKGIRTNVLEPRVLEQLRLTLEE